MKNTWLIWVFVVGIIVTTLVALNYEGGKQTVPLSEIFPEEGKQAVDYEFVEAENQLSSLTDSVAKKGEEGRKEAGVQVASEKPLAPTSAASAPASAKTPTPPSGVSSGMATSAQKGRFTVQVAAFKEKSRAEKAVSQAKAKGYPAFMDQRTRQDGGLLYQIYVGRFDAKQEASAILMKLRQDYKDCFIKMLAN